jgi:SPP1 family predicted phage head-tail adaptor
MGVKIGKLKERIEIWSYGESTNSIGEKVRSFTKLYDRWAQFKGINGSENFETSEKTARRFAEFKIRVQGTTINETMRIVYKSMNYNITSIVEDEYKEYYTILAIAKDND